jgi:hypothetical protein
MRPRGDPQYDPTRCRYFQFLRSRRVRDNDDVEAIEGSHLLRQHHTAASFRRAGADPMLFSFVSA